MNERLTGLRTRTRAGHFSQYRQLASPELIAECDREGLSWPMRMARLTQRMCESERVVVEPDERIVFTRTLPTVPAVYTTRDLADLTEGRTLHEGGIINNVCADWGMAIGQGLLGRRRVASETRARALAAGDGEAVEFSDAAVEAIDAVLALAGRYAAEARRVGNEDVATVLDRVPAERPRTFHEALQSLRFLQAMVWLSGHHHVGLGRLDQYLWPYLSADLKAGRLDEAGAEDLLAELFIALNRDSDLYPGIQQGDNGQSMTLGGVTPEGRSAVNPLTWMALRVARDVGLIDPKVNLRIGADTDQALLELGTELTRKGLGFPQYANDDVVIPALASHGYDLEDARDYTVAACWEFIIPGRGMDVGNIGAVSFPAAADTAIREGLAAGASFEDILSRTEAQVASQVRERTAPYEHLLWAPAPWYSVLMTDALERGLDHGRGAKYRNLGIHGAAAASAADALAAVQRHVFDIGDVTAAELLEALAVDFVGHEMLRRRLAEESPRVGLNEPLVDGLLCRLYDWLADACEARACARAHRAPRHRHGHVLPLAGQGPGRWTAPGASGRRDRGWATRWRPLRRQPGPHTGHAAARTDQRPAVVRQDRLRPHLQRRAHHARALGLGVPERGVDRQGGATGAHVRPARWPAAAAQRAEREPAPRCQGPSRGAPRSHRPRLGLERLLLRALPGIPGPRHLEAPLRGGLRFGPVAWTG